MGEGFLVEEGRGGVRGLRGVGEEEGEDFLVECCWGGNVSGGGEELSWAGVQLTSRRRRSSTRVVISWTCSRMERRISRGTRMVGWREDVSSLCFFLFYFWIWEWERGIEFG